MLNSNYFSLCTDINILIWIPCRIYVLYVHFKIFSFNRKQSDSAKKRNAKTWLIWIYKLLIKLKIKHMLIISPSYGNIYQPIRKIRSTLLRAIISTSLSGENAVCKSRGISFGSDWDVDVCIVFVGLHVNRSLSVIIRG